MLVKRNLKDSNNSRYVCDRCKVEINLENKVAIYVALCKKQPHKQWDLCNKCYKALIRGIKNS